jgi:hypothetical protein
MIYSEVLRYTKLLRLKMRYPLDKEMGYILKYWGIPNYWGSRWGISLDKEVGYILSYWGIPNYWGPQYLIIYPISLSRGYLILSLNNLVYLNNSEYILPPYLERYLILNLNNLIHLNNSEYIIPPYLEGYLILSLNNLIHLNTSEYTPSPYLEGTSSWTSIIWYTSIPQNISYLLI